MISSDAASLSSIRTYLIVALIFEIIAIVGSAFGLWGTLGGLIAISTSTAPPTGVGAYFAYGGIGSGVVFFLLGIVLTIPIIFRTNKMLGATNRADIAALKKLSSVGWGIIALIFSGVIPGIMLLVADGRIKSLGLQGRVVDQSGAAQLDKIAKLKSLLDSGAITQQEFDEQKKRFLSQA